MEEANIEEGLLRALEERLLRADVRQSLAELDALLADDFLEFGSSGRIYNKRQVLGALQHEAPATNSITAFRAKVLAPNVVLVTYQARRSGTTETATAHSLRSSLWQFLDGRWQIIFHQGTTSNAGDE